VANARWPFSEDDRAAFRAHFDWSAPGCWTWNRKPPFVVKPNERGGYGSWRGRRAHVVAWEMANGPVPIEAATGRPLEVCHSCDVRNCVRAEHLFTATHAENHRDAARKGRKRRGPPSVVTDAMVIEWRRRVRAGESRQSLATEFGVVISTVIKAVAGTGRWGTRKHLPGALGYTNEEVR
jgi:hypothetical protein